MDKREVEHLKALLEQNEREKRKLVEQLKRATTSSSPTAHCQLPSPGVQLNDNGRPRSNTVPRNAAAGLAQQLGQAQQEQSRPMKRSKTAHATGSSTKAPMVRSISSISRPGPKINPFVAKGPSPITPPATRNTAGPGILGDCLNLHQVKHPTNTLVPDGLLLQVMQQNGDFGREMDPAEFLLMRDEDVLPTTSPVTIQPVLLFSPHESEQFASESLPSACGSMTTAPTLDTAPMSRCNSSLNDNASIASQFNEMVRLQSRQSTRSHTHRHSFEHGNIDTRQPSLGELSPATPDCFGIHVGSFPYAYPSSAPTHSALSLHQHAMKVSLSQSSMQSTSSAGLSPSHDPSSPFLAQHLSMERSVSRDSIKSNASLKLRAKEALARQNGNAAKSRHLQPKPAAGVVKREAAVSAHATGKDGKAIIAKAKYERPKHPKVMCNQCNEQPDGFRGEHELRRHTEAKHKSMVKKWICRDPDLYGIPHSERAVKALKDCKQCSNNKQYGAYYNAAAHLRRTHFNVKPRKGAGGSPTKNAAPKADEEKEKRGGKGGGDWPSMSELKLWMVEVTVPMDQAGALTPDGTESVGAVDPEDFDHEFGDSRYPSQGGGLPLAMGGPDGFDMAAFAGVGGGFSNELDVPTAASFSSMQGELGTHLSNLYRLTNGALFVGPALHDLPISSAAFDYRNAEPPMQPTSPTGMPPSFMSIGSHGYTSPVSSTATITQAGAPAAFADQVNPQAASMQAPGMGMQTPEDDDLADLPFDLTFNGPGQ